MIRYAVTSLLVTFSLISSDLYSFPKKLSEWELFRYEDSKLKLKEEAVPYTLINPLFSDYAVKFRSIILPKGGKLKYKERESFTFPVGTVISKTFAYPKDGDYKKPIDIYEPISLEKYYLIETRLLVKKSYAWLALPYVWNDAQNEATLKPIGLTKKITITRPNNEVKILEYKVPNINQCKGCHIRIEGFKKEVKPIGPKARFLNTELKINGEIINQLVHWERLGLLNEALPDLNNISKSYAVDNPNHSLDNRARSYLDINCSHCHSKKGPANTSGLFLEPFKEIPNINYGICKRPVASGSSSDSYRYDIEPGHPQKSLLYQRLKSTDPSIMMPELGRSLSHSEGTSLIKGWIEDMPGYCD